MTPKQLDGTWIAAVSRFPRDASSRGILCACRVVAESPQHGLPVALRIFADRDGQQWRVWNVQPTAGRSAVRPGLQDGWLCFERLDGSCRCRLPVESAPADWDVLPDDRLDLLRQTADTA